MNENFRGFWGFFRGIFSESDGTPSFSRAATGVVVVCSMFWVRHVVGIKHEIPDLWPVCMAYATLYGINRGAEFLTSWKGKQ